MEHSALDLCMLNASSSTNTKSDRVSDTIAINRPRARGCGRDVMRLVSRGRRFCCQQPASSSWWMSGRSVASSCRLSFTPPTVWASEPSLTCTHARSFSAKPTPSPVRVSVFAPQIESACILIIKCPVSFLLFLFLEQHFTEVVQGEEFLGLTLQQVCSLISSDKLTVSTEEKVSRGAGGAGTHLCVIVLSAQLSTHSERPALCAYSSLQLLSHLETQPATSHSRYLEECV